MKKEYSAQKDTRKVVIYARKSKITNKGDSIKTQEIQSEEYARNQLQLPVDYQFEHYEDLGLSGFYADRPNFQRMIHDIEQGKIRAIACYKLDRISRKTSDLMNLLDFLEKYDVALLVCSNNINTQVSTSKIIIQVLAIIAEFERDIITERLQDNLMELAKDGRWMGGTTPTGFAKKRITVGSGKSKTSMSFLEPLPDEKLIVQNIFEAFLSLRSYNAVATLMNKSKHTKKGKQFTILAVRNILDNPVYCVADKKAYKHFLEHGGNIYGNIEDFDGQHGIAVYNRTEQGKVEDDESSFFNPKFSHVTKKKPIEDWIISVGKHEGFIPSDQWIEAQMLMDKIADKHNRPHRSTNAMLSGIMYCPCCGNRLTVVPESNRWTNGKPRFKYACPQARKHKCNFKAVHGVEMDEFILEKLSDLSNEESEYYTSVLQTKIDDLIKCDKSEAEIQQVRKAIQRLNNNIQEQVRNLREADESIKKYIQADLENLAQEIECQEELLHKLEDTSAGDKQQIRECERTKQLLLSFADFAESSTTDELIALMQTVVERIYITQNGSNRTCHMFLKGNSQENYQDLFTAPPNNHNNREQSQHDTVCDSDRNCELYPYLCGHSTSTGLR